MVAFSYGGPLGPPFAPPFGRDNTGTIPSTLPSSWTSVAPLRGNPAASRAPPAPLGRYSLDSMHEPILGPDNTKICCLVLIVPIQGGLPLAAPQKRKETGRRRNRLGEWEGAPQVSQSTETWLEMLSVLFLPIGRTIRGPKGPPHGNHQFS